MELIGDYTIRRATRATDVLDARPFEILYGLNGHDTLSNTTRGLDAFLVGGAGNDIYRVSAHTYTFILENGDSPNDRYVDVISNLTASTLGAIFDGRHLGFFAEDGSGLILFIDWERPANKIEQFDLVVPSPSGLMPMTLRFDQLKSLVDSRPDAFPRLSFDQLGISSQEVREIRDTISQVYVEGSGIRFESLTADQGQRVAYLYEAALDRDGNLDLPGLNFWIDQREAGLSEHALAERFLDSPEFEASIGGPDETLVDRELVAQLYLNVLDRPGEENGIQFWTAALADPNFDRADLLLEFADSPENLAGSPEIEGIGEIAPGLWDFA